MRWFFWLLISHSPLNFFKFLAFLKNFSLLKKTYQYKLIILQCLYKKPINIE